MQSTSLDYRNQSFPVSDQALRDWCNIDGTRETRWAVQHRATRYRVLNITTLTPIQTGKTGPYGDAGDITDLVTGFQITMDATRDVPGSATMTMIENPAYNFDPLQHAIQPLVQIWDGLPLQPGSVLVGEVPLGIFFCILPDRDIIPTGNVWTCTMSDLTAVVKECGFINTYVVASGLAFTKAVSNLLTMGYLPLSQGGTGQTPAGEDDAGPNFAANRISLTTSALTTPSTVIFDRTTVDKLAACNQLLDSIVYYHVWADQVGSLHADPVPNLSTTNPATVWNILTNDPSSAIVGNVTQRFTNSANLRNCIVVYRESTACAVPTLLSVKYNVNTGLSRIALGNLQRCIMGVIRDDSCPDQPSCDNRASIELQLAAALQEQITVSIFPNPFLQLYDFVDLQVTDGTGATTYLDSAFKVVGWSIDPGAWTMSLTLAKAIPV